MDTYIYIFVIVFFVVAIPLALYFILKPMFQHNKLLNGVVNYDTFMRKYVFGIELTKDEFFSQLKTRNINDVLEYSLNDDYSVITYTMYNMKYSYKIKVDDFNESIILRVEQLQLTSKPAFRINEFFIKKFNAKPLEFEKFKFWQKQVVNTEKERHATACLFFFNEIRLVASEILPRNMKYLLRKCYGRILFHILL